jgi:hypothetical protein
VSIKLNIPALSASLMSPEVVEQVAANIERREAEEASNPYLFRRYLDLHADHIITEVLKRETPAACAEARPAA